MTPPREPRTGNVRKGQKGFVTVPLADRFWQKVERHGPDECWPWLGSRRDQPGYDYGMVWVDGAIRSAPKVAWELANGQPFPLGMMACHHCDNPPCVNPSHVFPGSMHDNIADAVVKRRIGRGANGQWRRA